MSRWIRQSAAIVFAVLIVVMSAFPAAAESDASSGNAAGTVDWANLLKKPVEERQELYQQLRFDTAGWKAGDVLSREPFVVVSEAGVRGSDAAAMVRIWTGWFARVDDDLVTVWDEIWIGPDGDVILAVPEMETVILDYFKSPTQSAYWNKDYVGRYPWVSIPTDAEAEAAKLSKVPGTGVANAYGLKPEGEADLVDVPSVQPLPVVPDRIRPKRVFPEVEVRQVPKDIENHWAREDILALMRKGVVTGYNDGTIRPQKTLTRAEFITLLMKGLQLNPSVTGNSSTYSDVKKHWAGAAIAEAERLGILPKGDGKAKFGPNEPVTRLEMALWIANALPLVDRTDEGPAVSFKDTGKLNAAQQTAIRKAVNNNLLKGYVDGTFKPERSLTRAEAFVVTYRLTEL